MKKLILALFLVLLFVTSVTAAGSVDISSVSNVSVHNVIWRKIITISWVADSADGTVPSASIVANTYGIEGWYLYSVETNPGAIAPTDNYDIVINDANDYDICGGLLANRNTINTELVNIGNATHGFPIVLGDLIFVLTNNVVNSATSVLILTFVAN